MHEIFHIVPIAASRGEIYEALVNENSLQKWWLADAKTTGKLGSIAKFPLSSGKGEIAMKIVELIPQSKVCWECLDHVHKNWIATRVEFHILDNNGSHELHFKHRNWKTTKAFMD